MTAGRVNSTAAWRAGLAAAMLVLLFAVLPAVADAAKKKAKPGKLQTATASATTSASGQAATATATCPQGTTAIGGGFASATSTEGGLLTDFHQVTESRRFGKTSWVVSGFRVDGGAAGPALELTAEAYCRKNAGKISEVSGSAAAVSTTSFLTAQAACPLGRAVVGGGFKLVPPGTTGLSFLLLQSRPLGVVGWTGSGLGVAPAAANSLTEYAYCRKGSTKVAVRSASGPLPTSPGVLGSVTAPSCPAKKYSFAGGFDAQAFSTGTGIPIVLESRRSGGVWKLSALNLAAPTPGSLTAHSLCS